MSPLCPGTQSCGPRGRHGSGLSQCRPSLGFRDLNSLDSACRVPCRVSYSLDSSELYLTVGWGLWVSGKCPAEARSLLSRCSPYRSLCPALFFGSRSPGPLGLPSRGPSQLTWRRGTYMWYLIHSNAYLEFFTK